MINNVIVKNDFILIFNQLLAIITKYPNFYMIFNHIYTYPHKSFFREIIVSDFSRFLQFMFDLGKISGNVFFIPEIFP
jgi:hypothetical protein